MLPGQPPKFNTTPDFYYGKVRGEEVDLCRGGVGVGRLGDRINTN